MFKSKPLSNNHLFKKIFVLCILSALCACDQKQLDDKSTSTKSKVKEVVAPKVEIKPSCLPATGNAMEEGQVTVCHYNTDSLALAYEAIVKENASKDDFGYALLKKTLPTKDLEDNFEDKQTWIKYAWTEKQHLTITIQMAGGEDTLALTKEKGSVKVVTTLSAD